MDMYQLAVYHTLLQPTLASTDRHIVALVGTKNFLGRASCSFILKRVKKRFLTSARPRKEGTIL
jgi:hypothetical protein